MDGMKIRLATPRLILRPLEPQDAGPMFGYRSRPGVFRYQIWQPAGESEIREFIERQKNIALGTPGAWFTLAITLRDGGEMIGDAGMHFSDSDPGAVEIGITLSPARQKRGYAAEALQEILRFLLDTLGKDRITASVDPRNGPSIRLLERVGMHREAFFPGSMVIRGETVDDVVYALRLDEYKKGKNRGAPDG
jgi:RimJ/RimL family protein N-acetyltransferase